MTDKKRALIAIVSLVILIAVQAGQSLWQINRLSESNQSIIGSLRLADSIQELWADFEKTNASLEEVLALRDVASLGAQRTKFKEDLNTLTRDIEGLARNSPSNLRELIERVSAQSEIWSDMASAHAGIKPVLSLPAYHRLDASRKHLESAVEQLAEQANNVAQASKAKGQTAAKESLLFTIAQGTVCVLVVIALGWLAIRQQQRRLGGDSAEVASIANAVADGNLKVAINQTNVEPDSVMAAMARMRDSLRQTVSQVLSISVDVATDADALAADSDSLYQKAMQQRESLEQTLDTVNDLDYRVRSNVEISRNVSGLSKQASGITSSAGQVVGNAVETMREIDSSSKRIAEIIGMIDSIAFQTNLLALNAAVEAARAGEQGRGFAVVATEVRTLAQRSAVAAKDINQLIASSAEHTEHGSALVGEAGKTMGDVVASIEQVSDEMEKLHESGSHQLESLSQVSTDIDELNRVTNETSELLDRNLEGVNHFKDKSKRLVEAVSFFSVPEE